MQKWNTKNNPMAFCWLSYYNNYVCSSIRKHCLKQRRSAALTHRERGLYGFDRALAELLDADSMGDKNFCCLRETPHFSLNQRPCFQRPAKMIHSFSLHILHTDLFASSQRNQHAHEWNHTPRDRRGSHGLGKLRVTSSGYIHY